jgi:hypothetical protein
MAPKRKPIKKPKQKQKQKQVVKQSVRVNVQSSGGSGAGGTSGPLPMQFRDTSGENQRLVSLVEQIARSRAPIQQAVPNPMRVPSIIAEAYNPENDEATLNGIFNAPINTNKPRQMGPASESEGETIIRRGRSENEKQRRREVDAARRAAREEEIREQAREQALRDVPYIPYAIGTGSMGEEGFSMGGAMGGGGGAMSKKPGGSAK